MCYDEIGLCVQNISHVLDSIIDTIGRPNVIIIIGRESLFLPLITFMSCENSGVET